MREQSPKVVEEQLPIEKVIERPTQTPLFGFTFATQKPLIKASL